MDSNDKQILKRKLLQELQDFRCKRLRPTFTSIIVKNLSHLDSLDHSLLHDVVTTFAKLCKITEHVHEDFIDILVKNGVIQTLVRLLYLPYEIEEESSARVMHTRLHRLKKRCAFILETLAKKEEYHNLLLDGGALLCLLGLLKRHKTIPNAPSFAGFLSRVIKAIGKLAHTNNNVKILIRMEDGIPPLVELLEYKARKVQLTAIRALRALAYNNVENVSKIVERNALPSLVLMLQSEDSIILFTTLQLIKTMVDSAPGIGSEVLLAGALQPVINLLSCSFSNSQGLAAFLLARFMATDSNLKVHISQRGAIPPLVHMLQSQKTKLQIASAYALVSLAEDSHNQVNIANSGGIEPMLNLLHSDNALVQHYAARVICCLAHNEVKTLLQTLLKLAGFIQQLKNLHLTDNYNTEFIVVRTILRLELNMRGRTLKYLIRLMCSPEERVRRHVVIALAYLSSRSDHETVFIHIHGLELLLAILQSQSSILKRQASTALSILAIRANFISSLMQTISPPLTSQMDLEEEFVNNAKLSDVSFLVEGKIFYAHKDRLRPSKVFQTMFEGEYREKEAKQVVIPNIKWDVFELMMRFIYTGTIDVNIDDAPNLLKASDQYLLENLKLICERVMANGISDENVLEMFEFSKDVSANTLKHACIVYMLSKFDKLTSKPWYHSMFYRILPDIRSLFSNLLRSNDVFVA